MVVPCSDGQLLCLLWKEKSYKRGKKKTYIIVSSQELKSFLKMLTYFGDEFESDVLHKIKDDFPACKLKCVKLYSIILNLNVLSKNIPSLKVYVMSI